MPVRHPSNETGLTFFQASGDLSKWVLFWPSSIFVLYSIPRFFELETLWKPTECTILNSTTEINVTIAEASYLGFNCSKNWKYQNTIEATQMRRNDYYISVIFKKIKTKMSSGLPESWVDWVLVNTHKVVSTASPIAQIHGLLLKVTVKVLTETKIWLPCKKALC